jgi:hypothetical protein
MSEVIVEIMILKMGLFVQIESRDERPSCFAKASQDRESREKVGFVL